jgi:DNA-directed RNA polymerase subunit M/transcription elongation factor TFIIS
MNKKISQEGEKIKIQRCPKCNDELIVQMKDGGTEVFECSNCKFKVNKKKK